MTEKIERIYLAILFGASVFSVIMGFAIGYVTCYVNMR